MVWDLETVEYSELIRFKKSVFLSFETWCVILLEDKSNVVIKK